MELSSAQDHNSSAYVFNLQIQNNLYELSRVNAWIREIVVSTNLSHQIHYRINLILEEAISNIILHGVDKDTESIIDIYLIIDGTRVELTIKDYGIPFSPIQNHDVTLPQSLQEAKVGGLGIHLIKSYTRTISYDRSGNQNILTMELETNP